MGSGKREEGKGAKFQSDREGEGGQETVEKDNDGGKNP